MKQASSEKETEKQRQEKVKAELSKLYLRFSTREGALHGYAGTWTFFRADSAEDKDINSWFRCLRTYEVVGSDPVNVQFRTISENQPSGGNVSMRPQDGLFQSMHARSSEDTYFSDGMGLSDAEKQLGLPECTFWRCVAVDPQDVIRIAPRLPPKLSDSPQEILERYPGWSSQSIGMGVYAFESFIEEGNSRWSMGALYSVHSLHLLSHFCIQEQAVLIEPDSKIEFSSLPFPKPTERLDAEAHTWLDGGSFKGEMHEVVWDEDGDMLRLPTRPAIWSPPPLESSTHRLFRYKDSMYAYYPLVLPVVSEDSPNAFDRGARFEMGGICNDDQEFRRLVLRYSPAGHVTSLTRELYKPRGSFEFEKRLSTSMRRQHSTNPLSPQPSARRLGRRAAKLEQAFQEASLS